MFPMNNYNVAKDPQTSEYILSKLAKDKSSDVRGASARNPSTSVKTLEKLSNDPEWYVRACLASNPSTPGAILDKLASDENWGVRVAVARSDCTPLDTLAQMANKDTWRVYEALARNPNTPAKALRKLSKVKSNWVRTALISNSSTPLNAFLHAIRYDKLSKSSILAEMQTVTQLSTVVLEIAEDYPIPNALAMGAYTTMLHLNLLKEDALFTSFTGEQALVFHLPGKSLPLWAHTTSDFTKLKDLHESLCIRGTKVSATAYKNFVSNALRAIHKGTVKSCP